MYSNSGFSPSQKAARSARRAGKLLSTVALFPHCVFLPCERLSSYVTLGKQDGVFSFLFRFVKTNVVLRVSGSFLLLHLIILSYFAFVKKKGVKFCRRGTFLTMRKPLFSKVSEGAEKNFHDFRSAN